MDNKYKEYLKSSEWLNIRIDILSIRKKCERCGSSHKLHVHHLTYKNIYNESPNDLEVLCSGCHFNEHKKQLKKKTNKPKKKDKTKRLKRKSILKRKLYKNLIKYKKFR